MFMSKTSPFCKSMSTLPGVVLPNPVACKIFRLMRSGTIKSDAVAFRRTIPHNASQMPSLVFYVSENTVHAAPSNQNTEREDRTAVSNSGENIGIP